MTPAERLRASARAIRADAEERAASLEAVADELERGSDRLLTLEEAMQRTGVSSTRVFSDAGRRGELFIERAGRKPLVRERELERWMRERASVRNVVKVGDREEARADHRAAAQRIEQQAQRIERANRRTGS